MAVLSAILSIEYLIFILGIVSGGNLLSKVFNCDSGYKPHPFFYLIAYKLDYRVLDRQLCSVYCSVSDNCQAFHSIQNYQQSSTFDCYMVPSNETTTAKSLWMKSDGATGYICAKAVDNLAETAPSYMTTVATSFAVETTSIYNTSKCNH
ncbi:hypothetical protein CHUAL_005389 [Chamberlinius hualienensis]